MDQNKPGSIINNLSSHASLLLSASPTIINSPLQTTSTNNTSGIMDDDLPEDNINFKKPQNEIFKKLDGKIQKIVAAHSNLNKLYALNDFSGVLGPKKPFELPPQLPRPPPWVPKVSTDGNCSQWADNSSNAHNSSHPIRHEIPNLPKISIGAKVVHMTNMNQESSSAPKIPTLTIDSAISKLHQRRQQQQHQPHHHGQINQQPQQQPQYPTQGRTFVGHDPKKAIHIDAQTARQLFPSTLTSNDTTQMPLPEKLNAWRLNSFLNAQRSKQAETPTRPPVKSVEERRKFQMQLINLFREEIAAVTKLAKLKFTSPQIDRNPQLNNDQKSLLKKSPQSLFNTIRRETSLLLNKKDPNVRSGSSLLVDNQARLRPSFDENTRTNFRPTFNRYQTIKVVVPPTEFFKHTCVKPGFKEPVEISCHCNESKADVLDIDSWCPSRTFTLEYSKLKLKLYRLRANLRGRSGVNLGSTNINSLKRKKCPQKSIDTIIDRLQAKCLSNVNTATIIQETNKLLQNDVSPSPSVSQTSRETTPTPPSSPQPIPVFRTSPTKATLGVTSSTGNSKIINIKAKKAKRLHQIGLQLGNYLDRECPQPKAERITVEQFAKCLNLVRSNDAVLQQHQTKLMQSELKWRMPVGDRPLRLRRIRGERIHMPASASYKATRKVGLQ